MAIIKLVEEKEVKNDEIKQVFELIESNYGFIPNILKAIAHCPDLLNTFVPFWASAYISPTIGPRYRSLAALGTARAHNCNYCVSHMTVSALNAGLTNAEIEATSLPNRFSILSPKEQLIVEYAYTLTKDANGVTDDLRKRLKANFSDAELVNLTLVIGLYNLTGRFLKALKIDLEEKFSK